MKRLFNFRLITAIAVSIICGAVAFYNKPKYGIYSLFIFFGAIAVLFALSELLFKDVARVKRVVVALCCMFFAVIGYGRLYIRVLETENKRVKEGFYTVTGRVNALSLRESGQYLELTDCRYDGIKGGDLVVYSFSGSADLYDDISVICEAYPSRLSDGNTYTFSAINSLSMCAESAVLTENFGVGKGIFNHIKSIITKEVYREGDGDSAVALALLTGDTSKLDYGCVSGFRLAGVAHVFAVSGMHVGLLYVAIGFLLTKIGIRRWGKAIVIMATLLIYVGVCGFSASAIRASVMCAVAIIVKTMGEKNDRINSLAIASIIISFVNIGDVFGEGFALSFTVSLSLIILAPAVKSKIKFLGDKISSVLSAVVSAQLAALPLCVGYFSYFPALAVVTNVLLLPVVTLTYYLLWIGLIIDLLLPFQAFGLIAPLGIIRGITVAKDTIAESGVFITYFPKSYAAIYFTALLGASDLVNISSKAKISSAAIVTGVIAISLIVSIV